MLKNRKIAILIAVAVAAVATLLGVQRSLSRLSRGVEDMFYSGIYIDNGKYMEPSINSHLENSAESAMNLATLLMDRPELVDKANALLAARRSLNDAEGIKAKNAADDKMINAFTDLLRAARNTDLTAREIEAATQYQSTFTGAHKSIANSAYHDKASEYSSGMSFIARMISTILPVQAPQKYAVQAVATITFR